MRSELNSQSKSSGDSVIPRMADNAANDANNAAIDRLVTTHKYLYIVAWGKFLGFTPETVRKYLIEAEAENAPDDAIQKTQGKWLCLADIENEENRQRVRNLANNAVSSHE